MTRLKFLLFGHSTIPVEITMVLFTIAWGARLAVGSEILGNVVTPDRAFLVTYLRMSGIFVGILYGLVLFNRAPSLRRFFMAILAIIWLCVFVLTVSSPAQSTLVQVATSLTYGVCAAACGWTYLRMTSGGYITTFHPEMTGKVVIQTGEDLMREFHEQMVFLASSVETQNKSIEVLTKEIDRLLIRIKVLEGRLELFKGER